MGRAYGRIALDHAQRLPAAFLPDSFEVDAGHHTVARPVMAPVVDTKTCDTGAAAGPRVSLLDRTAARDFVAPRIAIGRATVGQKHRPLGWRTVHDPQPVQSRRALGMQCDGAGLTVLAFRNEDGVRLPIEVQPVAAQGLTNADALPAQHDRDRSACGA